MDTKRISHLMAVVVAAFFAGACGRARGGEVAAEAEAPLTLEACLRLAEAGHPAIESARAAIAAAEGGVTEAAASWWPRLDAQAGYHRWQRRAFLPDGLLPEGMPVPEVIGPVDDWHASMGASVTLFDFGERRAAQRGAEALREAAKADEEAVRLDLRYAVKQAFFTLAAAQEQLRAAEQSLERAEANVRLAEARHRSGAVPRVDVLRAEAEAARAGLAVVSARSRVVTARGRLNTAMGRPAEASLAIAVDEDLVRGAEALDVAAAGEQALRQRPELAALREQLRAREAVVDRARVAGAPKVRVDGSFGWRDVVFLPETQEWSAGVAVVWPLFDGGARRGRTQRAEAERVQMEAVMAQARLRIREEVWAAAAEVTRAREALEASEALVEERREALRVVRAHYENGAALIVDLLGTEAALAEAEAGLARARWELRLAWAAYARATGEANGPGVEEDEAAGVALSPPAG